MTLTKKDDHLEEALSNFVEQFKDSVLLKSLVAPFINQVQDLEDALFEVLVDTIIETAVGVQLDGLGDIVGEDRAGRTDDDYRTAISARIRVNKSNGTAEDIISVLTAIVGSSAQIILTENFPPDFAHFEVEIVDTISDNGVVISKLVQESKSAGVRGIFKWSNSDDYFGFFEDPNALGFGDGEFAGALDT